MSLAYVVHICTCGVVIQGLGVTRLYRLDAKLLFMQGVERNYHGGNASC